MAARMTGELDVPVVATPCQVMTLPSRKLGNLHWRKSAAGVAPVVDGAVADYARTREERLANIDAVISDRLCK